MPQIKTPKVPERALDRKIPQSVQNIDKKETVHSPVRARQASSMMKPELKVSDIE